MAGRGRIPIDDQLAFLLACGATTDHAAQKLDIGTKTVERRKKEPAFQQKVKELRGEILSQSTGKLAALSGISADALHELHRSNNEAIRLGAIRTALQHAYAGVALERWGQDIDALKAAVAELEAREKERKKQCGR